MGSSSLAVKDLTRPAAAARLRRMSSHVVVVPAVAPRPGRRYARNGTGGVCMPMSGAERQRRYRERRAVLESGRTMISEGMCSYFVLLGYTVSSRFLETSSYRGNRVSKRLIVFDTALKYHGVPF